MALDQFIDCFWVANVRVCRADAYDLARGVSGVAVVCHHCLAHQSGRSDNQRSHQADSISMLAAEESRGAFWIFGTRKRTSIVAACTASAV
jgi:5-carboxymethyl-2-hydroxymuconate isomerase